MFNAARSSIESSDAEHVGLTTAQIGLNLVEILNLLDVDIKPRIAVSKHIKGVFGVK